MRRFVDLLLIIVLLVAVAYMFFVVGDQAAGISFDPSPTPTVTRFVLGTPTPGAGLTSTSAPPVQPALATTSAPTIAASPTSTATRTVTPVPSPTPTASLTPTITLVAPVQREINDSVLIGEAVVQAIETYHTTQGVYPPDLAVLVPAYIPQTPFTSTGREFFYRLFDPNAPLGDEVYWLAFDIAYQEHAACTYYRRLDYWDCNFSTP